MTQVRFKISRIVFPKNNNIQIGEFSILGCDLLEQLDKGEPVHINKYKNFTLISNTPVFFNFLDEYKATINKKEDKYGISYELISLDSDLSKISDNSKRAFLEKTLTPMQSLSLYTAYKDPFSLIENRETEKLLRIKGIGKKIVERLYAKYDKNLKYFDVITQLNDYNLSMTMIKKLVQTYGSNEIVIQKVKENVYVLADEIDGIGFKKADQLALNAGIPSNSPLRIKAFIQFYLEQEAQNGNSWVLPQPMFKLIPKYLNTVIDNEVLRNCMYELYDEKIIIWDKEKTRIGLVKYYNLEKNVYEEIQRLTNGKNLYIRDTQKEKDIIEKIENEAGFNLSSEQKTAVDNILNNQISLLIGYGGTGKTFLLKTVSTILSNAGLSPTLCTLSGKAACRIQEATGFEGATIHRTLFYLPTTQQFMFNKDNKLATNVVIVDECSFLGAELFYSLIQALDNNCKLILCGDDKQLAALGTGNIFFDLINSKKIPTSRLTQIHRQAAKSGIIVASKQVREGQQLVKNGWVGAEVRGELKDFLIDTYNNRSLGIPKIMHYYDYFCKNLKDTYNTQIILAMKNRGEVNTYELNNMIQDKYNPHSSDKNEILFYKNEKPIYIREHDKVINIKNNYKAEILKDYTFIGNTYNLEFFDDEPEKLEITQIFNGYTGEVVKIIGNYILVKFDLCNEIIVFHPENRKNLDLAYALTAHKLQGSEIPNTIFLIDNTSFQMNSRELVYTAITRATKKCALLSEERALHSAINTSQTINKQTYLPLFLANKI